MSSNFHFLIEMYVKLFAASAPIASMAMYISMTPHYTPAERWHTAKKACHVSSGIMIICAIFGMHLLEFVGLNMNSFRIAGGIIMGMMGLGMLRAEDPEELSEPEKSDIKKSKQDITVTPLAFPIISGPGAISSLMIAKSDACNFIQSSLAYVDVVLIMLTFYVLFYITSISSKWLSPALIRISSRLFGLIVLAMAVQFMASGVIGFIK